jgi:hypothetical protein
MEVLEKSEVVVTKKMDGENTTMYSDHIHARSLDSLHHPSRNWVKNFHNQIGYLIPEHWRVCVENLYAKHSIGYDDLPSYALGFSVWNERNVCLNWDETLEWFELLGITPVETLYRGPFDAEKIKALWKDMSWEKDEGYIVRTVSEFPFSDFRKNVAKFVRKGHVQTIKHWMHGQAVTPNKLLDE